MNKYELFQAIGSISDEKLDEAISYHKEKKQNHLKKHVMSWTLIIHHCFQW